MTRLRFFQYAVLVVIVAFCFGQLALASNHIIKQGNQTRSKTGEATYTSPTAALYPLSAGFVASPYVAIGTTDTGAGQNSDGTDLWPCFGEYSATSGPNPDCPYIGNPQQYLPAGGLVVGVPQYAWPTSSDPSSGIVGCGDQTSVWDVCTQEANWFEDWTGDTTDELLFTMEVTQGTTVIFNSGVQDYGSWEEALAGGWIAALPTYPFDTGFLTDANLGTLDCWTKGSTPTNSPSQPYASYYPLFTNAFPNQGLSGAPYQYEPYYAAPIKVKACGAVTPGALAKVSITVGYGQPTYKKNTTKAACTAADGTVIGPPCWTVTKYTYTTSFPEIKQSFNIWME